MDHTIEVTVMWKLGHQRFKTKATLIGRNINRIEEVPTDAPENADGVNCRLQTPIGEMLMLQDSYEDVVSRWKDSLETLD